MDYVGLYDIGYRRINGVTTVCLFCRDANGKKIIKKVTDFYPYVYIDKEELIAKKPSLGKMNGKEEFKTINGTPVIRYILNKPSDIYKIKEEFKDEDGEFRKIHEADVLFDLRYAIDEVDEVTPTKYKVASLDIETDCLEGFPKFENPVEPIICLTIYDNYSKRLKSFAWREDLKNEIKDDTEYFNNETRMLRAFLTYWKDVDCDILTGWNLQFDVKYLIARLDKLQIGSRILCNVDENIDIMFYDKIGRDTNAPVRIRAKEEAEIFGIVLFDLFRAYKKMHFGELSSYSLNNIAAIELDGEKKEKVINTGEVWRKDIDKLISYNRKDVELTYRIDEKCKLTKIFDDIKRFAGVRNINDNFFASRIHETRIMKKYKGKVVFPTKPAFKEKSASTMIKGAFVKSPNPGLYENVICLDAKSLYPSVIYTFNLSKEMISETEGKLINGVRIKQEPKGIMPSMIKELIDLKDRMKDEVAGTGQDVSDKMFAIKTFINSFYGINALTSFRLYDKRIAENITYIGRIITTKCSDMVEKQFGYNIIYNDTDSIFIQLKKEFSIEECVAEGKKIQGFVNSLLPGLIEEIGGDASSSNMFVEFEKVYKRILFQAKLGTKKDEGAKKRYAGLIMWEDNKFMEKVKIAGMASRRSDTPEVSKTLQKKIFKELLSGSDVTTIFKICKETFDDMVSGIVKLEDCALPVKLNKPIEQYVRKVKKTGAIVKQNAPRLRGVEWSNKNIGTKFSSGTKFKLVYVEHPETDVVCFEEEEQLKGLKIDWITMFDKCIYKKVNLIFKTMKWDEELDNLVFYCYLTLDKELPKKKKRTKKEGENGTNKTD